MTSNQNDLPDEPARPRRRRRIVERSSQNRSGDQLLIVDEPAAASSEIDPAGVELEILSLPATVRKPVQHRKRRRDQPVVEFGGELVQRFVDRYPFTLDEFQLDSIQTLAGGSSVLVTAPTGTGKTVVAEFGISAAIEAGARAIYTTPLRALSAQKFRDFVGIWGADRVGMITGETAINDRAPILVMTTEILRNRLVSDAAATVANLRTVVLDEFHFLADLDRGRVWEEVVLLVPPSVQLVCLSATIPNWDEVTRWLEQVHGPTSVVVHDERAVPLDVWYFHQKRLARVADSAGQLISRPRRLPTQWQAGRPGDTPTDIVGTLHQRHFLPAIAFVMSRRRTEEWAAAAVEVGYDLVHDEEARQRILAELGVVSERLAGEELAVAQLELLADALPRGLAFHHAGLVPALRELVERLFEAGLVGLVFATGTLALGINMPARAVILEQLSTRDEHGWRPLRKREYLQMAGRAGRRGKDHLGHIVVLEHPYDTFDTLERLLRLAPEAVDSAFQLDYSSALYLLDRYGREGTTEIYRRSFATFRQIQSIMKVEPRGKSGHRGSQAFFVRRKAEIERNVGRKAERIESMLTMFGYWDGRRVTERSTFLRRFFHGNALLTSELIMAGSLCGLNPIELAEVAAWLEGGGRSGRGRRAYQLPSKLDAVFKMVFALNRRIRRLEEEVDVSVSAGIGPTSNHGLVLRALRGESLSSLCQTYGIDPGDVYGRLRETEMWLRQLAGALVATGLDPSLAEVASTARVQLDQRAGLVGFSPAMSGLAGGGEPVAGDSEAAADSLDRPLT